MIRCCFVLLLAIPILALSGCSSHPSSGSLITSTSPLQPGIRGTIPAKGSDCQYRFLGILPLNASASAAQALSKAKKNADSDVLTDVTIDHNSGYYILFSNRCIRIEGFGVPRKLLEPSEQVTAETTVAPDTIPSES